MVNDQNYVFYFESDIAKVFPFRPTCSSYDSEINKKKVKQSQKGPAKKVNKCQTWISNVHVWDLLILVNVCVLCMLKNVDFMSILSSLRVSCDPNTFPMLSLTCCNVKYDVIKKILTWR